MKWLLIFISLIMPLLCSAESATLDVVVTLVQNKVTTIKTIPLKTSLGTEVVLPYSDLKNTTIKLKATRTPDNFALIEGVISEKSSGKEIILSRPKVISPFGKPATIEMKDSSGSNLKLEISVKY